jgi:acetate kinase
MTFVTTGRIERILTIVSAQTHRVTLRIIRTNEELMIARSVFAFGPGNVVGLS